MELNILDFIENSRVFKDTFDIMHSTLSVSEGICQYCINNKIEKLKINLKDGIYVDFNINGFDNTTFKAYIKDSDDNIIMECDKWNKLEFDAYIKNIISDLTKIQIIDTNTNKFKDLTFNTKYLKKNFDEKKLKIVKETLLKEIKKTNAFNDLQIEEFKNCIEENIDVNIIACPLFRYKHMAVLCNEYNKFRKTTSEEELLPKFLDFKNKIIEKLDDVLSDEEFIMCYKSFSRGTFNNDLENGDFLAGLKCAYLLDKSAKLGNTVVKTYSDTTFYFDYCIDAKSNNQKYGTVSMKMADGSIEKIFDTRDAEMSDLTPFMNAFNGHQVVKYFDYKISDYINKIKEHYNDPDYYIILNLGDGSKLELKPDDDDNIDTISVFLNDAKIYSTFVCDNENLQSLHNRIEKRGGIINVIEPNIVVEAERLDITYNIPTFFMDSLQKILDKNHLFYNVTPLNFKNGYKQTAISIDKGSNDLFLKIYKSFLEEQNMSLEIIEKINENCKKAIEDGSYTDTLKNGTIIKYNKQIINNESICQVYKQEPYEGDKNSYTLIWGIVGKDDKYNFMNDITTLGREYFNDMTLDEQINMYSNQNKENEINDSLFDNFL